MDSIEELLKTQLGGGQLESTAEFTIDSLRARRKLSENQLPGPGLWLVKLVQAAVAAKAAEIRVTFGKRLVEFRFDCPAWPWCPRELVDAVLSGVLPKEPFRFHFLAGLRGSILEDTLDAQWTVRRPQGRFQVTFSGSGTEISDSPEPDFDGPCSFRLRTSRPPRWPGLKQATVMPLKHLIWRTAEEYMAVNNFCWTCPVPLFVDGRRMERRYRASPELREERMVRISQQLSSTSPLTPLPTVLVNRELEKQPDRPSLGVTWDVDPGETSEIEVGTLRKKLHLEETWISWPLRQNEVRGGYLLFLFGHEMESRIEFVCDGAVVDTESIPWRAKGMKLFGKEVPQNQFKLGVRVLLAVDSSELDLSHFKVRESDALRQVCLPWLRALMLETVELCQTHSKQFKFRFAPKPSSRAGVVGSALLSAAARLHPPLQMMIYQNFSADLNSLGEALRQA